MAQFEFLNADYHRGVVDGLFGDGVELGPNEPVAACRGRRRIGLADVEPPPLLPDRRVAACPSLSRRESWTLREEAPRRHRARHGLIPRG
jgi:hypothetical protein